MIAIDSKQVLIFTPHKCASTTVREMLEKHLGKDAKMMMGPQGPWRQHGIDTFKDSVGKHSVVTPYNARNYKKYCLYRQPFDRFVSLWKHYVRYSNHDVEFPSFVTMAEQWKASNNLAMWFYLARMEDIVREAGHDVGLIHHNRLEVLNTILGTNIEFPVLHSTDHEPWHNYYTPELYRRVLNLA
jgi:hypothetical protein